jgi:hypothetical protein
MEAEDATTAMGQPKATLPASGYHQTLYIWFDVVRNPDQTMNFLKGGLAATVSAEGKVVNVTVYYAPEYTTDDGVHTGLTEAAVKSILGNPDSVQNYSGYHYLLYGHQGLQLGVMDDPHLRGYRTVYQIIVIPAT